jgi:hypothetical protein
MCLPERRASNGDTRALGARLVLDLRGFRVRGADARAYMGQGRFACLALPAIQSPDDSGAVDN